MISVTEAQVIIKENSKLLPAVNLQLALAAGHVLAADIVAFLDIPAFVQSSMDGYAIRFADKEEPLIVRGEMAAGTSNAMHINKGEAARIFTGAPLPEGADTVVMQEKTSVENNQLIIKDNAIKHGQHVRKIGAEISAGTRAMQQNGYLSPAAIGFLAGIGFTEVSVYPMPTVSIIVTGKELQQPGHQLLAGQVYESNSYSLTAALQQAGIKGIKRVQVDDDLALLKAALATALLNSDVVLLTGGVSVGDYDFVVEASRLCDVQQQFHRIKQKPGKPLFFGTSGPKLVFGLPGNPSSVLSCFYNYVLPALEILSNKQSSVIKQSATMAKNYPKNSGLTHFLKGVFNDGIATPLSAQESFQLNSFAQADCLICLEEAHGDYIAGEPVTVYLLPH